MTKKTETCASPAPGSPDAALAERLFEEPLEEPRAGKPFINFIPPGALSAIGRSIDDPALNWPWPYDDGELKAVLIQLPQDSYDASGRQVVYAARVYLAKLWAQRRGPKSKPNPIEELRNLKKAADALLLAVKALSIEAQGMLENKQRLYVPDAPGIVHLRYTVDAFLHEHRLLRDLKEPQPSDRRGRKVAVLERKFQDILGRIYEDAFAGVGPHRGFPAFEKAITEPLEKWGHTHIAEKSRQDRRRPSSRSTLQRRIKQAKPGI
jgi:hypothetical protein